MPAEAFLKILVNRGSTAAQVTALFYKKGWAVDEAAVFDQMDIIAAQMRAQKTLIKQSAIARL